MEVILLERVGRLGNMGDTVRVKNGFARNFLLPQKKALRATEDNKKRFEDQREELAARNAAAKKEAEVQAKKLEGVTVTIIRQASEDGKLYGSVSVRDVADALEAQGHSIERKFIDLSGTIKNTGAFSAFVQLHPELRVTIGVNVQRNESELPIAIEEETAEAAPEAPAAE